MSFDLFVWDPPGTVSDDQVRACYERVAAGEEGESDGAVGESERINAFFAELTSKYPLLDDLGEDVANDSPWSDGPHRADRWVTMLIRFSAPETVATLIEKLARVHGLLLLDPQDGSVYRP
jgi:hypothetical protein